MQASRSCLTGHDEECSCRHVEARLLAPNIQRFAKGRLFVVTFSLSLTFPPTFFCPLSTPPARSSGPLAAAKGGRVHVNWVIIILDFRRVHIRTRARHLRPFQRDHSARNISSFPLSSYSYSVFVVPSHPEEAGGWTLKKEGQRR